MNTMTLDEARKRTIGNPNEITVGEEMYLEGENWGQNDEVGTMVDWLNEIPGDEDAARGMGWHDWFQGDDNYDSWDDYRELLLSQLRVVNITE